MFLETVSALPNLADVAPVAQGLITSDNDRFLRRIWELAHSEVLASTEFGTWRSGWVPYVKGAAGNQWFEPPTFVVNWQLFGLQIRAFERNGKIASRAQNMDKYFKQGVAYVCIGAEFSARSHWFASIFDSMGASVFPETISETLISMNSAKTKWFLEGVNPTIHFQVGDVNRLPIFSMEGAHAIFEQIQRAFRTHELCRESSFEFRKPGPSPWRHAQDWAQLAVDRPEDAPLPDYTEILDPEPPTDHLSYALGVALGRFAPVSEEEEKEEKEKEGKEEKKEEEGEKGERGAPAFSRRQADHPATPAKNLTEPPNPAALSSILNPNGPTSFTTAKHLARALPHGILFLDTTLSPDDLRDGLGHPAAALLHDAWTTYGPAINTKRGLRDWLAVDFFKDVHRQMYDNRPIHWPLSSSGKTFVAWVNIHRFTEQTLRVLLADHLMPTLARLEGELNDLRAARDGADAKAARAAEKSFEKAVKAKDELGAFIADVEACADRGAPPTVPMADAKCPAREKDARYAPDLDDGVMINSAALWPLLEPQWKDPKKWWKELATASGRKDYDWSHLAMRYWPTRVDKKCQQDPSLGVAHGCFWRYHPERAWAWELRLQDEIGPEFRIEEGDYQGDGEDKNHRTAFLAHHQKAALAAIEKEATRRMGRGKKVKVVHELRLLEAGLWSTHPGTFWEMELALSERQGVELRITAPDEPEARAAFEAENPHRVAARANLIAGLVPLVDLFSSDDDPDSDEDDADSDSEEDDS